jgi:hypothetical protein
MGIKFTNNATATLAASISTSSTSLTVTTSQGALFPTLGAGDYFYATLTDSSNNLEIVKITARSGDTLTAVRAQEGTTARIYAAADKLELRLTAAGLNNFAGVENANTFTATNTFSGNISSSGTNTFSGANTFSSTTNFTGAATFANPPTFTTGSLPIASGGTGQITQQAALNALAGTQTASRVLRSDGTNTSLSQVVLTTDVTGALPVANGGTGAATFTSGAILKGDGTSAVSAASAADIVAAISTTAVALSTNSTNAIGYNQTWQNVLGSRGNGTTYTNSTGKPIMVAVAASPTSNNQSISVTVGGVSLGGMTLTAGYSSGAFQFIVPTATTYVVSTSGSLNTWAELR